MALASIAGSARKAEQIAMEADRKASEAVRVANEMAQKMSDHLTKQDRVLGEILANVKKEPANAA